jgi:hypothetical protein
VIWSEDYIIIELFNKNLLEIEIVQYKNSDIHLKKRGTRKFFYSITNTGKLDDHSKKIGFVY